MGTLGDRRAIKPLTKVLNKSRGIEDVFFVEAAAISLGKVDGEEAVKAIKKALKDPSPYVQELAKKILQIQ